MNWFQSKNKRREQQFHNNTDKKGITPDDELFWEREIELGIPFTGFTPSQVNISPSDTKGSVWSVAGNFLGLLLVLIIALAGMYWLAIKPLKTQIDDLTIANSSDTTEATETTVTETENPAQTPDPIQQAIDDPSNISLETIRISPLPSEIGKIQADNRTLNFLVGLTGADGQAYITPTVIKASVLDGTGQLLALSQEAINGMALFSYQVGEMPGHVTLAFMVNGQQQNIEFDVEALPLHSIELILPQDALVADGTITSSKLEIQLKDERGELFKGEIIVNLTIVPSDLIELPVGGQHAVQNGVLSLPITPKGGLSTPTDVAFTISANDITDTKSIKIVPPSPDFQGKLGGLCKSNKDSTLFIYKANILTFPAGEIVGCEPNFPNVINGTVPVTVLAWIPENNVLNGNISLAESITVLLNSSIIDEAVPVVLRAVADFNISPYDVVSREGYEETGRRDNGYIEVFLSGWMKQADLELLPLSGN